MSATPAPIAEEAYGLLWAVAVWFGNAEHIDHPYCQRDLRVLNAWVNEHGLTDPDVGRERLRRAYASLGALA